MSTSTLRVNFPHGQRAEQSPVFTRNALFVPASPERVWQRLIDAKGWPDWYPNARNVQIDGGDQLSPNRTFHWTTFGVRVHTTVQEFVPNHRLSWSGKGMGSSAYHGWVIEPRDGGSFVVTEETQQGLIPSLCRGFLRRGLLKWHQVWLEGIARPVPN
jgi:polyketide cyclase/dehydrase/lipid transport protein